MSNDIDRLYDGISRLFEANKQIQKKSGPIYDKFIKNTRIGNAAWQEAGRPRHVSQLHHGPTGEITYFFTSSLKNRKKGQEIEPATEADWVRWQTWKREREKLAPTDI